MVSRADPAFPPRWRSLTQPWSVNRLSAVLGGLGLAFVIAAAGFIAWREREIALREASDHAQSSAFFLADHAARLFEVSDVALRSTAMAIGNQDWDAIAGSQSLQTEMRTTRSALPYVEDVWLNDAAGRLRLTTFAFPAPASDASDREIFREVAANAADLAIGDPIVGKVTDNVTFLIARRLAWPDGTFRGMVSATIDLNYFNAYWNQLDLPNEEHIALLRAGSGTTLARFPAAAWAGRRPERALAAAERRPVAGSFVPIANAIGFYHRVGTLPLYVVVSFTRGSVVEAWRSWLWRFLPFPVAAVLALGLIMVLGARQSQAETRARAAVDAARAELGLANQRLEERVAERTADLQASNDDIQRFAYIVSHDLRAPLVNIMGFTSELQHLRADLFAPAPSPPLGGAPPSSRKALEDDFDEALGFIGTSIDKMDRLIKAILLLSREGRRIFLPEPIDMAALMQAIADGFAHRAQMVGASIALGALPAVVADRVAVEQIFSNLIDNAVKYLRPDVPGRIEIGGAVERGKPTFTVRDNGRGIDPRDHDRVFDLFRRAGPQDQPGEGIGLAYVRSLVRRLGGDIRLASELGGGSTFTVTLPPGAAEGAR